MKLLKLICHRIPNRCFKFNNRPMPICARCLGFYVGLVFGLISSILFGIACMFKKVEILIILVVFVSPLAIDGTTQLFKFRESNNPLRLITGLIAGFVCGIGIHYLLV